MNDAIIEMNKRRGIYGISPSIEKAPKKNKVKNPEVYWVALISQDVDKVGGTI